MDVPATFFRTAIKSTRKVDDQNLYIIDIFCHGVPSIKFWKSYLKHVEDSSMEKITGFSFRNIEVSWRGIHPKIETISGKTIFDDDLIKSYGKLFGNLALNNCYYHCAFAKMQRIGDLTLGDYWRIEKKHNDFNDGKSRLVKNDFTPHPAWQVAVKRYIKEAWL